jgi:hypothetical protein
MVAKIIKLLFIFFCVSWNWKETLAAHSAGYRCAESAKKCFLINNPCYTHTHTHGQLGAIIVPAESERCSRNIIIGEIFKVIVGHKSHDSFFAYAHMKPHITSWYLHEHLVFTPFTKFYFTSVYIPAKKVEKERKLWNLPIIISCVTEVKSNHNLHSLGCHGQHCKLWSAIVVYRVWKPTQRFWTTSSTMAKTDWPRR